VSSNSADSGAAAADARHTARSSAHPRWRGHGAVGFAEDQWLVIRGGCVVDVAGCQEDATRSADMIVEADEVRQCEPIVEVVRDEPR
jgi:hypothetical protein